MFGRYSIEIVQEGRSGTIRYAERDRRYDFYWEFGGGDTLASITVPTPSQWPTALPWAADRRERGTAPGGEGSLQEAVSALSSAVWRQLNRPCRIGLRRKMTTRTFRKIALGMDGAIEAAHMGHPDFRANGKIFATLHSDDKHGMVKLTPEQQQRLVSAHPDMFAPENGAWGRQGCTRVRLAAAEEEALGEAMTLAWQNVAHVVSKKKRR